MKKNILIVLILIGIIGTTFLTTLSLISTDGAKPSCEIAENGGSCTIPFNLEQERGLSSYYLDLGFEPIPSSEFSQEVVLTAVSSKYFKEEYNLDDPSGEQGNQHSWVYLYSLPSDWENVYQLRLDSRITGTLSANDNDDRADIALHITTGYIGIPYPYNDLKVCGYREIASCAEPYVIRFYERDYSGRPDEDKFGFDKDVVVSKEIYEYITVRYYHEGEKNPETGEVAYVGETTIPSTISGNSLKVFSHVEVDEDGYRNTDYNIQGVPITKASYKRAIYPTDLSYRILGEEGNIELFSGKQTDNIQTLDIAEVINDYCGRNNNKAYDCDLEIEFTSSTGGKIVVDEETEVLKAVSGSIEKPKVCYDDEGVVTSCNAFGSITGAVIDFAGNSFDFAGNSFDFEEHPLQAYITVGILFIGLLAIVVFLPTKKK